MRSNPRFPSSAQLTLLLLSLLLVALSSSCSVGAADSDRPRRTIESLDTRALDTDDDGKVIVRGLVIENDHGCRTDSLCLLRIETEGGEVAVIYHYGEWPPCPNTEAIRQGSQISEGDSVEVFAAIVEGGSLVTCESSEYYVRRLPSE